MNVEAPSGNLAPIVMIVFNRPDHTSRVLKALTENELASDSRLYIFSDAARGPQDQESVAAVRSLIHQVSGFKQVIVVERELNYGCSRNVLSAISEVLKENDSCIVVEDDVMPYPLFLTYMNEALTFYKNDPTLFSIGAYSHAFKIPSQYKEELFLLNRSCSWGWGTWSSAWDRINLDQSVLDKAMTDPAVRKAFARSGEDLLRTYKRSPEIWDLRVCFQIWSLGLKTIFPVQPMVSNIGRDGSGTHYNQVSIHSSDDFKAPTRIPVLSPLTTVDEKVRKAFNKEFHKSAWRKLTTCIAKRLGLYNWFLNRFNAR